MRDYGRQARTALKIYLERGRKALEFYVKDEWDEFINIMRLRNAAFHNFRAADSILSHQGIRLEDDPAVTQLWQDIRKVEVELADALNHAMVMTKDELKRNQRIRTSIGKYRSRRTQQFRFERSI